MACPALLASAARTGAEASQIESLLPAILGYAFPAQAVLFCIRSFCIRSACSNAQMTFVDEEGQASKSNPPLLNTSRYSGQSGCLASTRMRVSLLTILQFSNRSRYVPSRSLSSQSTIAEGRDLRISMQSSIREAHRGSQPSDCRIVVKARLFSGSEDATTTGRVVVAMFVSALSRSRKRRATIHTGAVRLQYGEFLSRLARDAYGLQGTLWVNFVLLSPL